MSESVWTRSETERRVLLTPRTGECFSWGALTSPNLTNHNPLFSDRAGSTSADLRILWGWLAEPVSYFESLSCL